MHLRKQRSFLLRPWYRDWVLSACNIGTGFAISDPGGPLTPLPGLIVMSIGGCIFLVAIIHASINPFRKS
jgi:hypothetical protein